MRRSAEQLRLTPGELDVHVARAGGARRRAARSGASVVFEGRGGDVRLDAHVLAAVQNALVQVVRNAVAHGIEPEAERTAAGKPRAGRVTVEVAAPWPPRRVRRGRRRARRRRRGRPSRRAAPGAHARDGTRPRAEGSPAAPARGRRDDRDLRHRGRRPRRRARRGARGRGALRRRGPRLDGARRGTTVELLVPLSVASQQALVVEAAGATATIPLDAVARTTRIRAQDVARTAAGESVVDDGKVIPFLPLGSALGARRAAARRRRPGGPSSCAGPPAPPRWASTASSARARRPAAAAARSRRQRPSSAGASLDADGDPQLVLDPDALVAAARRGALGRTRRRAARKPVLVIDDSLTTRMLEQSILESAGYEVDVAASAEEGLDKARSGRYALFLVDVEMPGMDGFEFVERTRADSAAARRPGDPRDVARLPRGPPARPGGGRARLHRQERVRPGRAAGAHSRAAWAEPWGRSASSSSKTRSPCASASARSSRAIRRSRSSARPSDGKRAIELCRELRPDVITLDMMLPVMSGLAATEYIMAHFPTPILIVSASTNRGELFKTYEALAAGAVDVLEKPRGDGARRRMGAALRLDGQARRADQGHHAPARLASTGAAPRSPRAPRRSCRSERSRARRRRRVDGRARARWSRSCAGSPRSSRCPLLFVLHIGDPVRRRRSRTGSTRRRRGAWRSRGTASPSRPPRGAW